MQAIDDRTEKIADAMRREPQPLLNADLRLGLIWSAKSGCTFGIKWFLAQCVLLETALGEYPWIHDFRSRMFYSHPLHTRALRDSSLDDYRFIRLVRNPFARCVSAYLAFCMVCHSNRNGHHEIFLDAIELHLGRPIGGESTFSFREFINFLESLDIDSCDMHVRSQTHPVERMAMLSDITVIKLETSESAISVLEAQPGLRKTNLQELKQSSHHTKKKMGKEFVGDRNFTNTVKATTPDFKYFYDQNLWERAAKLYGEDCKRYGYEMKYEEVDTTDDT